MLSGKVTDCFFHSQAGRAVEYVFCLHQGFVVGVGRQGSEFLGVDPEGSASVSVSFEGLINNIQALADCPRYP